ncbi:hypothetical protein J6590_095765 [Homalodisca vitripennis]|nr:hypothetical protein J6590_096192 [Homalodisca vitripennis]KAG8299641.1 hypothetical protein J6590_095765 [Homalodisca vitripennis]
MTQRRVRREGCVNASRPLDRREPICTCLRTKNGNLIEPSYSAEYSELTKDLSLFLYGVSGGKANRMNLKTYKLSLYVAENMLKEWGAIPIQPHLLLMTSVAQHARPVSRGFNTPMRGCRGLNTPVRRGTGGSTRPSGVSRAQHAHAGVSGAQHARLVSRGLNTPVWCPAGSTRPCGGVPHLHPIYINCLISFDFLRPSIVFPFLLLGDSNTSLHSPISF